MTIPQLLPARADQVDSLRRPARLQAARAARAAQQLDAPGLRVIEDDCIRAVVREQETCGLKVVTDGEFRRAWWHFDFLAGLGGVGLVRGEKTIQFHGVETKAESIEVYGRVTSDGHPMLADVGFLASVAGHPEDDHPGTLGAAFPWRPGRHQPDGLSRSRTFLRGHCERLSGGGAGVLCGRLI